MRRVVAALLREPLVHFLIAGALLTLIVARLDPSGKADTAPIVVTPDVTRQIAARWQARWGRAPDQADIAAALAAYIEEEALYREAMRQGLDQDDALLRRHLAEKMRAVLALQVDVPGPTEAQLVDARGATDVQLLSFEQRYLGDGSEPGERVASPLPAEMRQARAAAVDRLFGDGFAALVAEVTGDAWSVPLRSAYGWHSVRRLPVDANTAMNDADRQAAARAHLAEQARDRATAQAVSDVLKRYPVQFAEP